MIENDYYGSIIEDILLIVKDNLLLKYMYDDRALLDIKEFCKNNDYKKYHPLESNLLINFTKKALSELITWDFLYDFRPLE